MGKDLKGKELGIGISQRKDKRYTARYTDRRGNRLQFYDFKLSEVRKWLTNTKYEDEHGLLGDTSGVKVKEYFEFWINNYKKDVVSNNTVKHYKNSYYNHIDKVIGNLQVKKIQRHHLQAILTKMYDNGYAYGTMNQVKIAIHAIFAGAVDDEIILKNPAQKISVKSKEVEDRRVLTVLEQEEFLRYAKNSMYYNAYVLCLNTGLRSGEIGGLQWSDIDWERKMLKVKRTLLFESNKNGGFYFGVPKSKSSIREVPLTDEAILILKQQKINQFKLRSKSNNWETNPLYQELIFTSSNGKPTGHSSYNLNITRLVTNINNDRRINAKLNNTFFEEFKPMFMHALRHTFATRCIENGMNPKALQKILGHSSITVTMDLYVHVTDELKHEEINKLKKKINIS